MKLLLSLLPLLVLACRGDTPVVPGGGTPVGNAQSYGLWTPGPRDDCTAAIHNSYSVVGPDGKLYPTWHPPVDPVTGCSFGHDHGRDPRGSALYAAVGPIPSFPAAGGMKVPAGWLVEQAGFSKGFRRGGAGISTRHALALVNFGGTSAELLALAETVQAGVESRFGVRLEYEPEVVA